MQTNSVTTTGTTAAHTALKDNVTPTGPDIPLPIVILRAGCTVAAVAILKSPIAALCTTETARASYTVPHTKRPARAPILADIMTSDLGGVCITQATVLTIARPANATSR